MLLEIQPFKLSVFYCIFALATKMLTLKYHIYIFYTDRGLELATLTNTDPVFHILLSK